MYINNKKRKRIPLRTVLFLSALLVVLAVFITGIVMLLTKGKDIKDALVEMPFFSDDTYFAVGGNIVYTEGTMITCTDPSLDDVWKAELSTGGFKFTTNGSLISAVGEDVIMLFSAAGENLFSTRINGTITSVRLGKDKVALTAEQNLTDKTLSYIVIFDKSGNSIFRIDDISGKYVLDYGFDSEGKQFYLLELDVSGTAPVSRITTYRPDTQSITGIKELKDQLVVKTYIGEDAIYTMGTNRLSQYSSLNSESKDVLVYGWVLEDISTQTPLRFIYVRGSESMHFDIARVISPPGKETKINLPPGVFKIMHAGEKIYCFASNSIFVYTGDGEYLRSYDMPFAIDGASRAMTGNAFVTAGSKVYLLPLP